MTHRAVKLGVTTLVLSVAFGGLLWTTMSEGTEYYKHVDEVMVAKVDDAGSSAPLRIGHIARCIPLISSS